jgi:iron complex transport system permease protein
MPQSKPSTRRVVLFVLFLLLTIVALVGVSVSTGPLDLTVGDAYSAILHKFFPDRYEPNCLVEVVVWNLRLPRILLAILAGISLGTAGAIMQWALKNPLASPYTLGISSMVACGTSFAIIIGFGDIGGKFAIIGVAFIFTLIATAIILYISSRRWATPKRVVLLGIVMIVLSGAMTAQFCQFGTAENVKEAAFWTVGDLRASWDGLAYMVGTIVLCAIFLILLIYMASLFGVADRRIRTSAMVVASLLVAITVCFTGTIGFVGLLAPHICRPVIGDDHRFLILVSGLVGAILLLGSDMVARTVISPVIIPVGGVTAVIGVPFLVYLLLRKGRKAVRLT